MKKPKVSNDLRALFRQEFIEAVHHDSGFQTDEIKLFEWFAQETYNMISSMLTTENSIIKQQIDAGSDVNDSGIAAIGYFAQRMRYSHVIFLTSLFESFLDRACATLTNVIGEQNIPFALEELTGEKWSKRRRFLEGYGNFGIDQDLWSVAKDLMDVRNLIIHEGGSTYGIKVERKNALCRRLGLRFDGAEITVAPEYIKATLPDLVLLISSIQNEIQNVASRAKGPQAVP
jgi:hypothetical protein